LEEEPLTYKKASGSNPQYSNSERERERERERASERETRFFLDTISTVNNGFKPILFSRLGLSNSTPTNSSLFR
jgi:hypothetical protein